MKTDQRYRPGFLRRGAYEDHMYTEFTPVQHSPNNGYVGFDIDFGAPVVLDVAQNHFGPPIASDGDKWDYAHTFPRGALSENV